MNWRGRPLTSYRTVIELISATTTETGLTIRAGRDTEWYQKGIKITIGPGTSVFALVDVIGYYR